MKLTEAKQNLEFAKSDSAQIYRTAIQFHREQIRFLGYLFRETGLPRHTATKLMRMHAQEIKETYVQWEMSIWRENLFKSL